MHTVAVRVELPADRLSFVHSLRTLRDWSIHLLFLPPRQWPQVLQRVRRILGEVVLPVRANRAAPVKVKRKMSRYGRKRPEDPPWPQPTKPFAESFVIRTMNTRT